MEWFDLLYITLLLLANGFFVAAEFALVKVRVSQIDQLTEKGNWAARFTSKALDRLDAYLSASQLGITVASLALGNAIHDKVEPAIIRAFEWAGISAGQGVTGPIATVVPLMALSLVTFLHMALGEQAPKNLAIRSPRLLSLITAPLLVVFTYVFWPIIWLLNAASNLTLTILGLGSPSGELLHTEEEVRHILGESANGGFLSRKERIMIENVLNLEEKRASRVMVPRPDIVYLSMSRPLEENLQVARQSGHTRFPLCEDDLGHVLGMIHVKDLFRVSGLTHARPDLRKLAREVLFVPVSITLDVLLLEFQQRKVHIAMLLDEFGELEGLVTLENVLEELVGPIQDEFDFEEPLVEPRGEGAFEVNAICPLDVLEETCGVKVPTTAAETTGGLVLDLLGRMALKGDVVEINGFRLTVLDTGPTRINRIRVEPIEATDAGSHRSGSYPTG